MSARVEAPGIQWGAGLHWTSSKRSWCGFFASLRDGRILLRHEKTWKQMPPEDAAAELAQFIKERRLTDCIVVANPSLWPEEKTRFGYTVSETFMKAGVRMRRGTSDRLNGLARIHSLLSVRKWKTPDGSEIASPALLIHEDCKVVRRVFPAVMESETDPDDIRDSPDYYPILGVMYYAMSRPMPTPQATAVMPPDAIGHLVNEIRESLPQPDERGSLWTGKLSQ